MMKYNRQQGVTGNYLTACSGWRKSIHLTGITRKKIGDQNSDPLQVQVIYSS